MNATHSPDPDRIPLMDDPNATLEMMYIVEYLSNHGLCLADLRELSEDLRRMYMTAACIYASTRLAEVHVRAQFVRIIHVDF